MIIYEPEVEYAWTVLYHLTSALAFGGPDGASGVHQQNALGQDGLAELCCRSWRVFKLFSGNRSIAGLKPFSRPNDTLQFIDFSVQQFRSLRFTHSAARKIGAYICDGPRTSGLESRAFAL